MLAHMASVILLFVCCSKSSITFDLPQIGLSFNRVKNLSHNASFTFFWIVETCPGFLNLGSSSGLCWKRGKVSAENSSTLGGENGQFREVVSRTRCSSSSCEVRVRIASGSRANTPEPDARSI